MAPTPATLDDCAKFLRDKFPSSLLDAAEGHFFSKDVYSRFACEYDGNHEKAAAAFEACLAWRREYQPNAIDPQKECAAALKTAFLTLGGVDKTGAAVLLLTLCHPSFRGIPNAERVRLFVWVLEELSRRGKEYFVLLSDFTLVGKEKDPQGTATRDETTSMLDRYYPGRMRVSFMYNPPWFISSLAPLSTAFLSAKLKARVRTNCRTKDLLKEMAEDQLPEQCGGTFKTAATIVDGAKHFA